MKRKSIITMSFVCLAALLMMSFSSQASRYSRRQAKATIQQTSYIINEAYEIASYYSFWQTNNVSRAMYYNNYAQDLYYYHYYKTAIRYSLLARQYALEVIDDCDDYWEFFYYTYYGWSFRYGYNYNFAYRNGYRNGYYDGYYARYCYRYRHDYRHDPYRSMHADWYTDHRYADVSSGKYFNRNEGSVAIGRGESGRTGHSSSSGSSSSSIKRPGYTGEPSGNNSSNGDFKNVLTDNYFSQDELVLMRDLPNETVHLENEFKRNNPNVSFSDEGLSSKGDVVNRNRTNSSSFTSRSGNKSTVQNIELQRPTAITLEDGRTISGKTSDLSDEQKQTITRRAERDNVPSTLSVSGNNGNVQPIDRSSLRNETSSSISQPAAENNSSTVRRNNGFDVNNNTVNDNDNPSLRTVNGNENNRSTAIQRNNSSTMNGNSGVQRNNSSTVNRNNFDNNMNNNNRSLNNSNRSSNNNNRSLNNSNRSSNDNGSVRLKNERQSNMQRSSKTMRSSSTATPKSSSSSNRSSSSSVRSSSSSNRSSSSTVRSSSDRTVNGSTSSSSSSNRRISR